MSNGKKGYRGGKKAKQGRWGVLRRAGLLSYIQGSGKAAPGEGHLSKDSNNLGDEVKLCGASLGKQEQGGCTAGIK